MLKVRSAKEEPERPTRAALPGNKVTSRHLILTEAVSKTGAATIEKKSADGHGNHLHDWQVQFRIN